VPLAGAFQVFSTQVVIPGIVGFGIGSGVPKLQPVSVQSGSAVLTAGAVDVGPMLQLEPLQLSANRLCEPSGVGPSGMREAPAPMLSPPQVRFLMTVFDPSRVSPQLPAGAVRTKSRTVGGGWVVLVVVDVEVVVDDVLVVLDVEDVDVVLVVVTVVEVVVGTVVLVVTVVEVVVGIVVLAGAVVLVLDADGHSEKSILQSPVQSNAPPGDGHVKLPKALPSHSSPGSSMPLPQRSVVVVVVVVVVDVVVDGAPVVVVIDVDDVVVDGVVVVVVGDVDDVVVEDASGHSEKSILQSLVQSNAPLGDGHVKLPKALPSHSSPGSTTPLPQSSVVVVVVVVVDVDVVEAPVVVVVDCKVVLVVVVVTGTSGAHLTVTLRLPLSVRAHAAPVNVVPRPMLSFALGAVMNARTSSCAPKCTTSPATLSSGVGVDPSGPSVVSLPSRTSPPTLIVDWLLPTTCIVT
jgi:hypothetical protein